MMKLNTLRDGNKITAYGFKAFIDYAAQSHEGNNVVVSTLSPAVMADMGITCYCAPILPRGTVFNTAEDVELADLDVNFVTVFSSLTARL